MKIFTVEQAAEIDKKTEKDYNIPGQILMENAGKASAEIIKAAAADYKIRDIAVICGKGNNGGDGFVCARYLENSGFRVQTFLAGRKRDVKGDAKKALDTAGKSIPLREISSTTFAKAKSEISSSGLIVDALLGTGARGPLKSPVSDIVELIQNLNKPVISIDIPSGLDGNNGSAQTLCVNATETISMGFYKPGLLLNRGPGCTGKITIVDIGIPGALIDKTEPEALLLEKKDISGLLPRRPGDAHKGSMGKVLILGGSIGYTGAAILAARAAMRSGCGLVFLGCPRTLNVIFETALIETITKPLPETESGTLGIEAEEAVSHILESAGALAIGPGLGQHPETSALVKKIILTSNKPMVIDADAINNLRGEASILGNKQAPAVLTPHPGELAGLLGKTIDELLIDQLKILKTLSARHNTVIILKQARTVIALPGGGVFINPTGNPGMAAGGSGDVLTGMLSSFIARGMEAGEAAKLAVFMHGMAGDIAAAKLTEESMAAGDIIENLSAAFKEISA